MQAEEAIINVIEVGAPGEAYMECIDSFGALLMGSDEEMVEEAIRIVKGRGFAVVGNSEGGCCVVTRYSDGTVAVGVTVERR